MDRSERKRLVILIAVGRGAWAALFAASLCGLSPAVAAKTDDGNGSNNMLDIMSGYDGAYSAPDDKACDKEFYSTACDRWVHAYIAHDLVTAQSAWTQILTDLKNCRSVDPFMERLYDRIRFATPDDATNDSRFGLIPFYKNIVAFTEKAVGAKHRFMLDALQPLAWNMDECKEYQGALDNHKRALALLETIQPPRSFQLSSELGESARDLCHLKQYQKAEPLIRRAISISDTHHFIRQLQNHVQLYGTLLTACNRKAEHDQLFAKYSTVLKQTK